MITGREKWIPANTKALETRFIELIRTTPVDTGTEPGSVGHGHPQRRTTGATRGYKATVSDVAYCQQPEVKKAFRLVLDSKEFKRMK